MKAGAIEFLTKPLRDQDLLDAIDAGLARSHPSREREGPGSTPEAVRPLITILRRRISQWRTSMPKSLFVLSVFIAVSWSAEASAQQTAPVPRVGVVRAGHQGANAGTLSCNVTGGVGFIFGTTKALSCIFARPNGLAERYEGQIKRSRERPRPSI